MKKRFLHKLLPLSLALVLSLSACGQEENVVSTTGTSVTEAPATTTNPPNTTPTQTPATESDATATETPTAEPTTEPIEEIDWYQQMLNTSILSTGTNGRLEKVIQKIQNGEDVSVSLIGGSVTEGAGAENFSYAYGEQFIYSLQDTYPNSSIHYYNAGLGGTPSTLGLMRYERDVTSVIGENPDLVIVEFAVNDWDEPTYGRAYESLVRTILEKENEPAVILLFSVFQSKWNMQEEYIPIGELYGLPMVSILDATAVAYNSGDLNDELFFADIYHPTNYGHKIMADCLVELFDRVAAQDTTQENAPLPDTSIYSLDFMDMHLVTSKDTNGVTITPGGFSEQDTALQTFSRTTAAAFPDNWMHTADSGNKSFTAELTCKNILLSYKYSGSADFGFASIYIDGEFVTELYGYQEGGWNNCGIALVLDEQEAAPHTLEVKMSEGWEEYSFTLLSIGYTE